MNSFELLLALPLLLIEGCFSGAEIALLSSDRLKLQQLAKKGHSGAKLAQNLLSHPERIFSTTLLVNSFCVIALSSLFTIYFLHRSPQYGEIFAILLSSPLIVFIGELIPKSIAQKHANRIAPIVSYMIQFFFWVFYPITFILSFYSSRITKLSKTVETFFSPKKHTTRDELHSLISMGKKEADISTAERKMIKRIFDFKDTEAKHALIPLVKVDAISEGATFDEALTIFRQHMHSRIPVYRNRIDNIVGILRITDLMQHLQVRPPIQKLITQAQYVAETQSLDDLLSMMRDPVNEMMVVVDEYGGAVGVLTLEDILEELVGEIQDEYDVEHSLFKTIQDNHWIVEAKIEITQINEQLRLEIPEGEYGTLAGFLLQQFGHIPVSGEELYFDTPAGSLRFTVKSSTERRILTVEVEKNIQEV